jgi:hypothetical protein
VLPGWNVLHSRVGMLQCEVKVRETTGRSRESRPPRFFWDEIALGSEDSASRLNMSKQRGPFVDSEHAIEILHSDAAGAADEIVFAGEDDNAVADSANGDIEKVRP